MNYILQTHRLSNFKDVYIGGTSGQQSVLSAGHSTDHDD
jgi:hypothetical protein